MSGAAERAVVGFLANGPAPLRLFEALELAFPVRFERRAPGEWAGLDAFVAIAAESLARDAARSGVRSLALLAPESAAGRAARIELADAPEVDPALRGLVLVDRHGEGTGELGRADEHAVMATRDGRPAWLSDGRLDIAARAPVELGESEALRERLEDGRAAALLPLVHLLRELADAHGWRRPEPRATFVLDDPNLHWPSYGHVRFEQLIRHAGEHGYHMSLATVPADGWFAHPRALALARAHPDLLSLTVHGNDHDGGELGRLRDEHEALAVAAHAMRRARAFERRHGVAVDRVMVPPHEACSEPAVRALVRVGFEAVSMTRPYPWLETPGASWLARPPSTGPLPGFAPADSVAGGLPVLLRHPFMQRAPAELAFRAFLGQPLILYGHHADLADGLEVLAAAADQVRRALGPVRWCSLGSIARDGYSLCHEGGELEVRLFARRARIEVPDGVERLRLQLHPDHDAEAERVILDGVERNGAPADPMPVCAGTAVELELHRRDTVDPDSLGRVWPRPLAIARRVASEGRDRAQPLLARVRAR